MLDSSDTEREEPYEVRASRTVLWEAWAEMPLPTLPQVAEVRNQHQLQDTPTDSVEYTNYKKIVRGNLITPSW